MLDITLVIPAYEEEATIKEVVEEAVNSGFFKRVIVVNDGSRDDTSQLAKEAGAFVIDLYPNKGKGVAMKLALDYVESEWTMFWDADLRNTKTEHFQQLIEQIFAGKEFVIGVLTDPSQEMVACWSGQKIISTKNARLFFDANASITSFGVDGAMVAWAKRKKLDARYVSLRGIRQLRKPAKKGFINGWIGYIVMWYKILSKK